MIIVYQSNPRGKPLADQTKVSFNYIIYLLSLMDCGFKIGESEPKIVQKSSKQKNRVKSDFLASKSAKTEPKMIQNDKS